MRIVSRSILSGRDPGKKTGRQWRAGDGGQPLGGLAPLDLEDGRIAPPGHDSGLAAGQRFHNPLGSAQAYFRIQRPHRLANRELEIAVEVLADSPAAIRIDYDSTDHTIGIVPVLPGAFKPTPEQTLPPSGRWEQLRFTIADARFCGGVNTADFRVVSSVRHGPLFLRSVSVSLPGGEPEPAAPAARAKAIAFPDHPRPEVSIIIPTWNRLDMTLGCLEALAAHTEGSYEVIVVDNGSAPEMVAVLRAIRGLRLKTNDANLGFARGCNDGAAMARGRSVLFLNNDTIPEPGWLPPLLAAGRRDPRVAIAGSLLLYPDTREVQHAGIDFNLDGIPFHRFRFCPFETHGVDVSGVVQAVTGACLLTPRDFFGRLGGFDEGFVNGYEDVDFCLRAAAAGGLSYYCSDSVLLHHESGTPGRLDRLREAANLDYLLRRWRKRVPSPSHRPEVRDTTGSAPQA